MDEKLATVLGMSISYIFSLAGMIFAWIYYRRHKKVDKKEV